MLFGRQHLDGVQPRFCQLRPAHDRQVSGPQSVAVPALRVDVQLCLYLGILQGEKIHYRVLDVHRIVLGLEDERRPRAGSRLNRGIGSEVLLSQRQVARINDDGKIGLATQLVCRVNRVYTRLS